MAGAVGLFVLILGGVLIWNFFLWLFNSNSEGVKRLRTAIVGLMVLLFTTAVFNMGGPVAVVITYAVIGVLWWIVKGFNK